MTSFASDHDRGTRHRMKTKTASPWAIVEHQVRPPSPRPPPRLTRAFLVAVVGLVSVATACSNEGDSSATPVDGAAIEQGAELYASNCASCHGADLRGTDQGPSHLSILYEPGHHSDDAFRSAVANGSPSHHWDFGSMPPISGLDDDEVTAVIAYVRAEQERQGFEQ